MILNDLKKFLGSYDFPIYGNCIILDNNILAP